MFNTTCLTVYNTHQINTFCRKSYRQAPVAVIPNKLSLSDLNFYFLYTYSFKRCVRESSGRGCVSARSV